MEITDIYVAASTTGSSSSVGYGTVTFDNILRIRFNIMKTKDGARLFVNWPSQKGADNKYYPQVSFVQDEESENPYAEKNAIEDPIIKEFNRQLGTTPAQKDAPAPKETPKETPSEPAPKKKAVGIKFAPMPKG